MAETLGAPEAFLPEDLLTDRPGNDLFREKTIIGIYVNMSQY